MDGEKLGWKNEWELGNCSQVGEKKVSVLEDRGRLENVLNSPKPQQIHLLQYVTEFRMFISK